jgi:hypothetical protein
MVAALGGAASAFATALYRPKPPAPAIPMIKGKMMVVGDMAVIPPANPPTTCPITESSDPS